MRPHRNARRFSATAAPFSSIARRIAASPTGTSPRCQATPSSSVFIACALPNSRSASCTPCSQALLLASTARSSVRRCSSGVDCQMRVALECGGRGQVHVAHHRGAARHALQHAGRAAHRKVGGQHQVGGGQRDAHHVQRVGMVGDLHMRHDRAVLLRQAGEIQRAHRAAFQVRRHGQHRAGGDDAAAADAGEQPAPHAAAYGSTGSGRSRASAVLPRFPGCGRRPARPAGRRR